MGIFSFLKKKNTAENVLVIDIGSSSVTASYVVFGGATPIISASVTSEISVLSDLSFSRFESEMMRALQHSISGLHGKKRVPPDRIQVYLASPWYASQVRVAKVSRPTPFVVTKVMLGDIIAKELKAFEDEEVTKKIHTNEAIRVIESNTLQVKLNGYAHNDPISVIAHELELSIFLAISSEHILKKIEDHLSVNFGHRKVIFSSFIGASFVVSRDFFPHQQSYILVDIGGEVTDVSYVKDGTLIQSTSFPEGKNFMLRRLSIELKRSIPESVTLCMLYMENKVENSIKETCEKILTKAKEEWLEHFQKALFSTSNELSLPDTILITVDSYVGPWFVDAIKTEKFGQYALTEKEFKIIPLDATFFHTALDFEEGVPRNPFSMIEVLASARKQK